ncbi:MAG: ABC transporter ATP-binding protein [Ardenticatenaceae bacterium]
MEPAVEFHNVSKRFTIQHERPRSLQEAMIRFLHPRRDDLSREDFWALQDVSFVVPKGKTVGLIGTNGSGKSTALKLMAGILQPTDGEIVVDGRLSALLELGSGMHPELTGRENIFLNGSLLGIGNAEMRRLYPRIVGFAELERFIDMPIKHYSSGMYMRLGFSVAIHVRPDILLLDEVLAVGDQSFQTKCLERIYRMKQKGTTIILVSHGLNTLEEMCDELIWLKNGVFMGQGKSSTITQAYLFYLHEAEAPLRGGRAAGDVDVGEQPIQRWGSREVEITAVRFRRGYESTNTFLTGDPLTVEIDYYAHERVGDPMFGLAIHHVNGTQINGPNNKFAGLNFDEIEGAGTIIYTIPDLPLMPGAYELSLSAYDALGIHAYDVHWRAYPFQVHAGGTSEQYGLFRIQGAWEHRPGANARQVKDKSLALIS